ncbi:MAG: hypothetical protein EPN94_10960 [Nitrospirae bacterium]|nr:MAG: hypothetical protein EPN94_10960 [Nitrospirota bacterium]
MKGIGGLGCVSFKKNGVKVMKVRLWVATVFFMLMSIGAIVFVSWGIDRISPSDITPPSPPLKLRGGGEGLQIAGAGDEGYRAVTEGK